MACPWLHICRIADKQNDSRRSIRLRLHVPPGPLGRQFACLALTHNAIFNREQGLGPSHAHLFAKFSRFARASRKERLDCHRLFGAFVSIVVVQSRTGLHARTITQSYDQKSHFSGRCNIHGPQKTGTSALAPACRDFSPRYSACSGGLFVLVVRGAFRARTMPRPHSCHVILARSFSPGHSCQVWGFCSRSV